MTEAEEHSLEQARVNFNTETNYWPAEPVNLAECEPPRFAAPAGLMESGREVAQYRITSPNPRSVQVRVNGNSQCRPGLR